MFFRVMVFLGCQLAGALLGWWQWGAWGAALGAALAAWAWFVWDVWRGPGVVGGLRGGGD